MCEELFYKLERKQVVHKVMVRVYATVLDSTFSQVCRFHTIFIKYVLPIINIFESDASLKPTKDYATDYQSISNCVIAGA